MTDVDPDQPAADFSTCDLCDAHKARLGTRLVVLGSQYLNLGGAARFRGEVRTVKCFEDNSRIREAADSPGEGRVLVVDGGASLRRALVGGNIAAAAERSGWAGFVIHGAVRDRAELAACSGLGVRALGLVPLPTDKKGQGERDVPIALDGAWIAPGDMLYADEDGIVVLRM